MERDSGGAPEKPEAQEERLRADLARLSSLSDALKAMAAEMAVLETTEKHAERGYYSSAEHDRVENLLFRYLGVRETLWEMIDYHRDYATRFDTVKRQTKSFTLAFAAASQLCYYSSLLVREFLDDSRVIAKLNEAFPRSEIPAGTYDAIFDSLTKPENIQAVKAAEEIFSQQLIDSNSPLSILARDDPNYRSLIAGIEPAQTEADARLEEILSKRSLLLPETRNLLRHSSIVQFAREKMREADNALYAIRGLAMTRISRIKRPGTAPVRFTEDQIAQLKAALAPGDVILTYSSGYMSNLFLPGVFKHGITYVGSPEERQAAGLAALAGELPESQRERYLRNLETATLPDGEPADLVEGLAEGVIFNSSRHLLTARVNRLVVWRPRLSNEERARNLSNVFRLIACGYDFNFDFNEANYQCCTEVIYRALNGIGAVAFSLTPRMGRQTLSADDFCLYALKENPEAFELIALAAPEKESSPRAKVFFQEEAMERLNRLMEK